MGNLSQIFTRGINFVRNNPQIIYTLFLVVAIPVAFFFTSEQFLRVASDNQDRLERSRVALLLDAIIEFLPQNADRDVIQYEPGSEPYVPLGPRSGSNPRKL